MKRQLTIIAAMGMLLVLLSGCTGAKISYFPAQLNQRSDYGNDVVANLQVENSGLYLFYYLPIVAGNMNWPNRGDYHWFRDQLRNQDFYMLMDDWCERLKANHFEDVQFSEDCAGGWTLWILWRRTRHAEAVAVNGPKPSARWREKLRGNETKHLKK